MALLAAVLVVLGVFAFANGLHDASNTFAAAVRTRALTPLVAVRLATMFTALGAVVGCLLWPQVLVGFQPEWLSVAPGAEGLVFLLCVLVAGTVWSFATWLLRMPSSSLNALVGGAAGAALATGWVQDTPPLLRGETLWREVLLPLVALPVLCFALAYGLALWLTLLVRHHPLRDVNRKLRLVQSLATAAFSLAHGVATAQRLVAVGLMATAATGYRGDSIPVWLGVLVVGAFTAGTWSGGWRLAQTLANRLVPLNPLRGALAQSLPTTMYLAALALNAPVSSTHLASTALVGAGAVPSWREVNTPLALNMLAVWVATPLASGTLAALLYLGLSNLA